MVEAQYTSDANFMTLTRYIIEEQQHYKEASGDFTILLQAIQTSCKYIGSKVNKAGIANLYGVAGQENQNASGDTQKKLDVLSNEVFINVLKTCNKVAVMVSEEDEKPIEVNIDKQGKYFVAFDPLDGSSNIDANVSIGTIFAIWKRKTEMNHPHSEDDYLRTGADIISTGYCLYGSSIHFLLALPQKVSIFTYDPSMGEFILSHNNVKIPKKGKIYSINEGNASLWPAAISEYIKAKKFPETGSPYSLRYIGSMVADIHRTILYGGIFLYPGDKKSPEGKLRVLYECFPMAFIMEQCGGKCITGKGRLLDIQVKKIHQRCPIICGSPDDVADVEASYEKYKDQ